MQTEEKKVSYQQVLLDRCTEWWESYEERTEGSELVAFDWPQILCDFVKSVALESFKNGVTVGKRRGGQRLDGARHSGKVNSWQKK
jgi:hypothetical protein